MKSNLGQQHLMQRLIGNIYTVMYNLQTEKYSILDRENVCYYEDLKDVVNIDEYDNVCGEISKLDNQIKRMESIINEVSEYTILNLA